MPKLPVIKDRQLIKVLKTLGFYQHSETGSSHLVFKHHDGRRTTVARHAGKDIPSGTLKGILRDIQLSVSDLIKLLN